MKTGKEKIMGKSMNAVMHYAGLGVIYALGVFIVMLQIRSLL